MNFHTSLELPETPSDYISLVSRYIALAPYLVSKSNELPNRISHPDLHLDNIFINPKTNQITCIIDWQRTSISPMPFQRPFPQMLEITSSREDEHTELEKSLLGHYQNTTMAIDPLRWEVLNDPLLSVKINPPSLVPCCWDHQCLFPLRNALIAAMAHWDNITNHSRLPCPIDFTTDELLQHQSEMELIEGILLIMHQLQDEEMVPFKGMVKPEFYEKAKKLNGRICWLGRR